MKNDSKNRSKNEEIEKYIAAKIGISHKAYKDNEFLQNHILVCTPGGRKTESNEASPAKITPTEAPVKAQKVVDTKPDPTKYVSPYPPVDNNLPAPIQKYEALLGIRRKLGLVGTNMDLKKLGEVGVDAFIARALDLFADCTYMYKCTVEKLSDEVWAIFKPRKAGEDGAVSPVGFLILKRKKLYVCR